MLRCRQLLFRGKLPTGPEDLCYLPVCSDGLPDIPSSADRLSRIGTLVKATSTADSGEAASSLSSKTRALSMTRPSRLVMTARIEPVPERRKTDATALHRMGDSDVRRCGDMCRPLASHFPGEKTGL